MTVVVERFGLQGEEKSVRVIPDTPSGRIVKTGPTETVREDGVRVDITPIQSTVFAVPQEQVERMRAGVPLEIRRTARERYQALVRMLFSDATKHFYKDGAARWPKSIEDEIRVIGAAQGKANLMDQVEVLARKYVHKAAAEQKAADHRRIALDWSGHYTA